MKNKMKKKKEKRKNVDLKIIYKRDLMAAIAL